jgi:hypothetical protein
MATNQNLITLQDKFTGFDPHAGTAREIRNGSLGEVVATSHPVARTAHVVRLLKAVDTNDDFSTTTRWNVAIQQDGYRGIRYTNRVNMDEAEARQLANDAHNAIRRGELKVR